MSEATNEMFLLLDQDLDVKVLRSAPGPDEFKAAENGEIQIVRVTVFSPEVAATVGKPARIDICEATEEEPSEEELEENPDAESTWSVDWIPVRD